MTNLEWIKSLTKEELAHLITDYANDCCQGCIVSNDNEECNGDCINDTIKWLDSERSNKKLI